MPDNIFKVDTGRISIPDMGAPRVGSIGSMGSALNNIARMQQRQYEMEMARQMQDDKNKAALFGKLSEYGLGAEEDQKRLGFTAMNPAQAEYLKWANGEINKQIEAFTQGDSSQNSYAKVTGNIRNIINDPTGLQMRYENNAIKRAADEIEKFKPNLHEAYFDELNRHRSAKGLGEYDMNKIVNWKDYVVEPMDLDGDLKELKNRGISWQPSVDPNSGKVVVTQTQDNVEYTNKYIGAKYAKGFGLDYDRLVASGQDPQMTKDDYVAQRIAETSNGIAIKETTGEFKGNLGNTMEREKAESAMRIEEAKQKEANKFEYDRKMEEERRITKATAQEYKSERNSKGEFTYKSPFKGISQSGENLIWKDLDKAGIIDKDNYDEIKDEVLSRAKELGVKDLTGDARKKAIAKITNEVLYERGDELSEDEVNIAKGYKGLGKNGGKMKVTFLDDGTEIDLDEQNKKTVELSNLEKISTALELGSSPAKGIKSYMSGETKKGKTYKSRFTPEVMMADGNYGGSFMSTNPEFAGGDEITGEAANEILGDDKAFNPDDKVYVKKGTVKANEFGRIIPTEFKTKTVSQSTDISGRNNNPLNIRKRGSMEFETYDTLEQGFQAAVNDIERKKSGTPAIMRIKSKLGTEDKEITLNELIETWSPRKKYGGDNSDDVVDNYIKEVSKELGVDPSTPLSDIDSKDLALAMSKIESPKVHKEMVAIISSNRTEPMAAEGQPDNGSYIKKRENVNELGF